LRQTPERDAPESKTSHRFRRGGFYSERDKASTPERTISAEPGLLAEVANHGEILLRDRLSAKQKVTLSGLSPCAGSCKRALNRSIAA
jgi:hypothetical protein